VAAEKIGRCRCPVCKSDRASLTLAKSRLSVLTCNGCNFQGFARSDKSDELLRARLIPEDAPAAPAPAPVRETPPVPVRTGPAPINPAAPVRTAPAEPAPVQAAERPSWGLGAFR
jgi:hypothetical protein